MPISEDEFDSQSVQEPRITMSKAELRKTHKPIMEKRRRARINQCLNEIKSLVLEAMNKDPSRHSKLEKADILEMAVKHLQSIQRQQLAIAMASNPTVVQKFTAGFNDCAEEIDKCLNQIEGVGNSLKQGLSSHLRKCINGIEQVAHINLPDRSHIPFLGNLNSMTAGKLDVGLEPTSNRGDANNNPYLRLQQNLQSVSERLRPSEMNVLLTNLNNSFHFAKPISASHIHVKDGQRPSAFATVIPSTISSKLLSPPISPKNVQIFEERSSSPPRFKPIQLTVNPVIPYASPKTEDDAQVCQISSTSTSQNFSTEIKPMKFPIQSLFEKKASQSQVKIVEPLCIITNQNERFRLAQSKEDSAYCEENIHRGVKRKFGEMERGLLIPSVNVTNTDKRVAHCSSYLKVSEKSSSTTEQCSTTSRPPSEETTEMWRPW